MKQCLAAWHYGGAIIVILNQMDNNAHTYGLSFYLPTTSTGTDEPNQYKFRSAMNNGLGFGWKYFEPEFDP